MMCSVQKEEKMMTNEGFDLSNWNDGVVLAERRNHLKSGFIVA